MLCAANKVGMEGVGVHAVGGGNAVEPRAISVLPTLTFTSNLRLASRLPPYWQWVAD